MTITGEEAGKAKKKVNIEIREMEIDDLAAVFHLGELLFTAETVPNLYRTWDEYEIIQLFQSDSEYCLVAEADDRLVGFALGATLEKSRSAWKYGLLVWLGVAPEYQKYGVGGKLFSHFKELVVKDGVRIILVDTEADNIPALKFFRKLGFGRPVEHIYLSLNLSGQKKAAHPKKNHRHDKDDPGDGGQD
ncbi:MAG: GNAT family N-acetyltransferase [Pseudomonadota bacterium]